MAATMIHLIRHGATVYHETGQAARDDPLSGLGRAQADALRPQIAQLLDVSVVLVSPLDRALETAVRAFADRPDVRFVVIPALREFNMRQKTGSALFARHTGVPLRALKLRYGSPAGDSGGGTGPTRAGIEWPADTGDDDAWWEPHGSFCDPDDEHAVIRRIQRTAAAAVWAHASAEAAAGRRVAVVAHENVFRALAGWARFPTAQVVPVMWTPPLAADAPHGVTPLAALQFVGRAAQSCAATRRVGGRRKSDASGAVAASPGPAKSCAGAAGDAPAVGAAADHGGASPLSLPPPPFSLPLRCSIVLACTTDQRTLERRLAAAFAFAAAHPDELVLVSASPDASLQSLLLIEGALDGGPGLTAAADGARILIDYYARDTVASAERALARLAGLTPPSPLAVTGPASPPPWRIRLVTDDWHMPRAIAIFWDRFGRLPARGAPHVIVPAPVPCPAVVVDCLPDALLLDARHAAQRWFGPDAKSDALLRRIDEVGAGACLVAVGRNYRAWARRWATRTAPSLDDGARAAVRAECEALRAVLSPGGSADGPASAGDADAAMRVAAWARLLRASFAPSTAPSAPPAGAPGPFPLALLPLDAGGGATALHLAAARGGSGLCRDLLCWFGAAAYACDAAGRTAADVAAAAGWPVLAESLAGVAVAQAEADAA